MVPFSLKRLKRRFREIPDISIIIEILIGLSEFREIHVHTIGSIVQKEQKVMRNDYIVSLCKYVCKVSQTTSHIYGLRYQR